MHLVEKQNYIQPNIFHSTTSLPKNSVQNSEFEDKGRQEAHTPFMGTGKATEKENFRIQQHGFKCH